MPYTPTLYCASARPDTDGVPQQYCRNSSMLSSTLPGQIFAICLAKVMR